MAPDTSPPGSPYQPTLADGRGRLRGPEPGLPPGSPTQLGNYDILARVAEGGMGVVYQARHRLSGAIVAVKVISPGPARNPVVLQRFEREFQAARVLEHPNVVKAIEYHGNHNPPYLVMEYVDGESLGQRLERAGPIPEDEAVRLVGQVCDGLQRAHKQGLVHRDVKPDNVMVTHHGVAKLTDMGLVKDVDNDLNLTKTGRGLGTPHFMAPEQFRNAKAVDVRGDIYSLAATLYSMVTGVIPFSNSSPLDCWLKKVRNEFPTPRELNPAVSERVDWAIRRAMSAEPSQRPASCREFYEDLTGQSRPGSGYMPRPSPHGTGADNWFLVYRDETGTAHTVKGGTDAIRDALRDGLLGDASTILVGRLKTGQFQPLRSVPEFRDLVIGPGPLSGTHRAGTRPSGTVPPAAARHPDSGTVDLGAMPTGGPAPSRSGKGGPGGSSAIRGGANPPSSGANRSTRPTGRVTAPSPRPLHDPAAETLEGTTATPAPPLRPGRRTPVPDACAVARKPFDWTPVIAVVAMLVSAAVGFLVFNK
jgi:serine/threonine protein kinase